MPIAQFEGRALVFNNGVVDVKQGDTSLVDSEKVAHIPESNVAIDNETIIRNANNQLEVPIDEDTIYMDDHGFMKAKVGEGKTYAAGANISINSENVISAQVPEVSDSKIILCTQVGSDPAGPIGSFTLNQASNKTITIPIPEPEVKEYTGGNDIEVTSEGIINYTGSGGGSVELDDDTIIKNSEDELTVNPERVATFVGIKPVVEEDDISMVGSIVTDEDEYTRNFEKTILDETEGRTIYDTIGHLFNENNIKGHCDIEVNNARFNDISLDGGTEGESYTLSWYDEINDINYQMNLNFNMDWKEELFESAVCKLVLGNYSENPWPFESISSIKIIYKEGAISLITPQTDAFEVEGGEYQVAYVTTYDEEYNPTGGAYRVINEPVVTNETINYAIDNLASDIGSNYARLDGDMVQSVSVGENLQSVLPKSFIFKEGKMAYYDNVEGIYTDIPMEYAEEESSGYGDPVYKSSITLPYSYLSNTELLGGTCYKLGSDSYNYYLQRRMARVKITTSEGEAYTDYGIGLGFAYSTYHNWWTVAYGGADGWDNPISTKIISGPSNLIGKTIAVYFNETAGIGFTPEADILYLSIDDNTPILGAQLDIRREAGFTVGKWLWMGPNNHSNVSYMPGTPGIDDWEGTNFGIYFM